MNAQVVNRGMAGWWLTGKLTGRLLCLGAILGAAGAITLRVAYTVTNFSPVFLIWGLFLLIVFEVPIGVVLGLTVGGVVIVARRLLSKTSQRLSRAAVTGLVASVSSAGLAFALFSVLPLGVDPWVAAGVSGVIVGSVFASVSYRHLSEMQGESATI